jgi:phage protein D
MSAITAYASAPTLTIGGTVDVLAQENLLSLAVEEDTVGLCWCEATFRNWGIRRGAPDYLYLSRDVIDFGTTFSVTFGPEPDQREVFAGKVTAVQADYPASDVAQATILAEDGLQGLRMTRRTRTFTPHSSTSDIADQIAREHGLTAEVDLDGPTRAVTAQLNTSDLAFLRGLARSDDGEVWLNGTALHVARRPDRDAGGDAIRLTYGGNLLAFSVRADLAHQISEITVTGWSVADKDAVNETADSSSLGGELGSLTGGSTVLADTLGERKERVVRAMPLASDDARAWAKAAYLEKARQFVCGSGSTGGTPHARVGGRVTLEGLGPMFNGDYTITRTRHSFDITHGYRTHFDVERAGIGATS